MAILTLALVTGCSASSSLGGDRLPVKSPAEEYGNPSQPMSGSVSLEANGCWTIDLGEGARPHCALFGPKNGLLYVTTELQNSITIIDPATLQILGQVPTGRPESHMLAITSDGKRMYITNSLLSTMDRSNDFWLKRATITDAGMKLDDDFMIDFTKFKTGAARGHGLSRSRSAGDGARGALHKMTSAKVAVPEPGGQ